MSKTNYLFFGFAGEYVLQPLCQYMQQQGFNCTEIDLASAKNIKNTLKSLKQQPVVFVNSAHVFFDAENFQVSYQYVGEIISPLEVIDYLQPVRSVYLPHDLTDLFHKDELPWLSLFDYLLVPVSHPYCLQLYHTDIVNVGWIKRNKAVVPVNEKNALSVGLALSEFEYYRRLGPEKTYDMWSSVLQHNVVVKFPHWKGAEIFEDYFRKKNVTIFPHAANISDFIDSHGIVLTNSLSSVNSEAAFAGRKVINVLDRVHGDPQTELRHLPNICFMDIETCSRYLSCIHQERDEAMSLTLPQVKPFNFELATKVITEGYVNPGSH